jgi:hypothetical protein
MATLQTARQSSAFTAKSRLKQVVRDRMEPVHSIAPDPTPVDHVVETVYSHTTTKQHGGPGAAGTGRYPDRLSDLEQRQLLLHAVTLYSGWHLVSVQNRPESDVLVAYLVRNRDYGDPVEAIRSGRAMQILMDAVGDMKVQHPRRRARSSWLRWFWQLAEALAA